MELVTVPLELAKEAVAEVAKETVKAAEGITQFGKVDKAIEIEATSFGKANSGSQISFGSLANGEFKHNENYLKWKDGIGVGEVNKAWIEELTNEISAIYGNDKISVSK